MKTITKQQVLLLHTLLTQKTGGDNGLRDEGLLDSALNSANATFGGQDLFATTEQKAARLGFGLATNHPFVDGNKRIGVLVLLTFLKINNVHLTATNNDVTNLGMGIANGTLTYDNVLEWINTHKK